MWDGRFADGNHFKKQFLLTGVSPDGRHLEIRMIVRRIIDKLDDNVSVSSFNSRTLLRDEDTLEIVVKGVS